MKNIKKPEFLEKETLLHNRLHILTHKGLKGNKRKINKIDKRLNEIKSMQEM